MKRSTERILTTHTGSLPRPPQVVELMLHEQNNPGAKAGELKAAVRRAVADVVIDLPGQVGDAAVSLPGLEQKIGPTSTAVGSAMLHGLMVEVAGRLLERGVRPPVLLSENLDSAAATNVELLRQYKGKVSYL